MLLQLLQNLTGILAGGLRRAQRDGLGTGSFRAARGYARAIGACGCEWGVGDGKALTERGLELARVAFE